VSSQLERKVMIESVRAWRNAAVADGWHIEPTYQHESADRAARLRHPEGFIAQVVTREKGLVDLHIWGPDGLAINPYQTYDMDRIRAGIRVCMECHAHDVDTQRVGFAGRVCINCLPAARKSHEFPGWTN